MNLKDKNRIVVRLRRDTKKTFTNNSCSNLEIVGIIGTSPVILTRDKTDTNRFYLPGGRSRNVYHYVTSYELETYFEEVSEIEHNDGLSITGIVFTEDNYLQEIRRIKNFFEKR